MPAIEPPVPSRAIVIVIDSMGVGALPDAHEYGDVGSDTLAHIAHAVPLRLPWLRRLGLAAVADIGPSSLPPIGAYGKMAEASPGKDSVTGHWELMGLVLDRAFPTFPLGFPPEMIRAFEQRIGRRSLGNIPASGTVIIESLGPEHLSTGAPIVYTSADSVFQIAAHEDVTPLADLYAMCDAAFDIVVRGAGVGRVIARPFTGTPGRFVRTANRRDFAQTPHGRTLLDRLQSAGIPTVGIGKIHDLFAGRGVATTVHTASDRDGLSAVSSALRTVKHGLVFANLVDSDAQYGHRNDVAGYAANLEQIDKTLGRIIRDAGGHDVVVVTADHGNDPTTPSTDHSREYVPIMMAGPGLRRNVDLGIRATFADLGQTLAEMFGVAPLDHGVSFWSTVYGARSAMHDS